MNERKEGVLHIIFIFIGLALICLGTFYYFTDDKGNVRMDGILKIAVFCLFMLPI